MAKRITEKKDLRQSTLDFNVKSEEKKQSIYIVYTPQNFEPKISCENPRQTIYKKILEREMK